MLDSYAIDQLLPYMAIADDTSVCRVIKLSNHAKTAMWLLEQFFKVKFQMTKKDSYINLKIN